MSRLSFYNRLPQMIYIYDGFHLWCIERVYSISPSFCCYSFCIDFLFRHSHLHLDVCDIFLCHLSFCMLNARNILHPLVDHIFDFVLSILLYLCILVFLHQINSLSLDNISHYLQQHLAYIHVSN